MVEMKKPVAVHLTGQANDDICEIQRLYGDKIPSRTAVVEMAVEAMRKHLVLQQRPVRNLHTRGVK